MVVVGLVVRGVSMVVVVEEEEGVRGIRRGARMGSLGLAKVAGNLEQVVVDTVVQGFTLPRRLYLRPAAVAV
jgi:hypothetical protein